MNTDVQSNPAEHRYEIRSGDALAVIEYELDGERMILNHTFVPPELRGQGIAEKLVRAALADAREQKLTVVPECSYVEKFMTRHAEYQDLLAPSA